MLINGIRYFENAHPSIYAEVTTKKPTKKGDSSYLMRYGWFAQIVSLGNNVPSEIERLKTLNVHDFMILLAVKSAELFYQQTSM